MHPPVVSERPELLGVEQQTLMGGHVILGTHNVLYLAAAGYLAAGIWLLARYKPRLTIE